jgi:hypothetical protein
MLVMVRVQLSEFPQTYIGNQVLTPDTVVSVGLLIRSYE